MDDPSIPSAPPVRAPAQQALTGSEVRFDTVEGKVSVREIHSRALQP
ncbi:hypothetical protein [Sorangium atrum]|uniref:Uncharacterized protein n=1 Tax=Sorangium atrum TaxID=2995308 RepID=A0ABT5BTJ0_9BACT|nr:hypothetical protein [Sorangium aterium]MDC0676718.1 hypothetical protein [Sorangium aterium]